MRISPLLALALGTALLTGCGESSTPGKASKSTGREDVSLKIAHATEAGGDFAASERLYKQAIAIDPNVVAPHVEIAEFYHRHRKESEAIGALNDALALDPKNTAVMRDLANIYINNGSPDKALALLNNAIAINGKDAFLYNSQGVAYDMLGRYPQAQQSYRTALSFDPNNAMTFNANLSMSYILSGAYNNAISLLVPLLDLPDTTPTIRQNLAMAYGLKGDSGKALKLSLKDMPMDQARENIKFYRMVSGKHGSGKKPMASTLPISVVNEIFPEEPPVENAKPPVMTEAKPVAAPVKSVSIQNMEPPAPPAAHRYPTAVPQETLAPEAEAESVPSPEIKRVPPADSANSALPAAAPTAGWVLPTPVLKPE